MCAHLCARGSETASASDAVRRLVIWKQYLIKTPTWIPASQFMETVLNPNNPLHSTELVFSDILLPFLNNSCIKGLARLSVSLNIASHLGEPTKE